MSAVIVPILVKYLCDKNMLAGDPGLHFVLNS